jgi:hypothetical protein
MNKQGICNNCKLSFNYDNKQQSGKWCSNKCQMDHQYKTFIDNWKKGKETGRSGKYEVSRHIRRYLHEKNNSSCSCCGWNKINPTTGKTPLHIDHINGDFTDNTENNLRLICPNCHSLTENFGSLNKGKGRYKKTNTKHPKFKTIP